MHRRCRDRPPPAPAAPPTDPAAHGTVNVYVTFYGGPDNDPPGSTDIAYPNGRHGSRRAAPAATPTRSRWPPTRASCRPAPSSTTPQLQKYFVMEDDCAECIAEWGADHRPHVDLWTGPAGSRLLACEEALTPPGPVPLEINPPADRPVDLRPLYDTATDRCWTPARG